MEIIIIAGLVVAWGAREGIGYVLTRKKNILRKQLGVIKQQTQNALMSGYSLGQVVTWACTQVYLSHVSDIPDDSKAWLKYILQGHPDWTQWGDDLRRFISILAGLDFVKGLEQAGVTPDHSHDQLEEAFEELEEEIESERRIKVLQGEGKR